MSDEVWDNVDVPEDEPEPLADWELELLNEGPNPGIDEFDDEFDCEFGCEPMDHGIRNDCIPTLANIACKTIDKCVFIGMRIYVILRVIRIIAKRKKVSK